MHIETKRLCILSPKRSDLEDLYQLQSDSDVMRFIPSGVRTKETVQKGLELAIKHELTYGYSLGSVVSKEKHLTIGRAGFIHLGFDETQNEIELAYALHKAYWGKGYATEIAQALIQWGFQHLDVDQLWAVTSSHNEGSKRVLSKVGMHLVKIEEHEGSTAFYYQIKRPSGLERES